LDGRGILRKMEVDEVGIGDFFVLLRVKELK
jgi:hypothetical protein